MLYFDTALGKLWVWHGDLDRRHASGSRKRGLEQANEVNGETSVGRNLCVNPLSEQEKNGAGGLRTPRMFVAHWQCL